MQYLNVSADFVDCPGVNGALVVLYSTGTDVFQWRISEYRASFNH